MNLFFYCSRLCFISHYAVSIVFHSREIARMRALRTQVNETAVNVGGLRETSAISYECMNAPNNAGEYIF